MSTKRTKTKPARLRDCVTLDSEQTKDFIWCTAELYGSKGKEHDVKSNTLEQIQTGEPATDSDLFSGNTLLWKYKGKPYKVTLISTSKNHPKKHSETDIPPAKKHCPENTDESQSPSPPVTPKSIKVPAIIETPKGLEIETPKGSKQTPLVKSSNLFETPNFGSNKQVTSNRTTHVQTLNRRIMDNKDIILQIENKLDKLADKVDKFMDVVQNLSSLPNSSFPSSSTSLPKKDTKYTTDEGVDLLCIRGNNPQKYALALMDALFTEEEMGDSCYTQSNKTDKPGLNPFKISLLEECIKIKFSEKEFKENSHKIRKSCSQKCLDRAKKLREKRKFEKAEKLKIEKGEEEKEKTGKEDHNETRDETEDEEDAREDDEELDLEHNETPPITCRSRSTTPNS